MTWVQQCLVRKALQKRTGPYQLKRIEPRKERRNWRKEVLRKSPEKQHSKEKGMLKMKSHFYKMRHRQVAYVSVNQVVFLTVNHRGPLPLRELHSTDETIVWRDPGGSWACLPPVYSSGWNHPATNYDTCRLWPEKQSEKKGAIWNAKKNKTTQLMNWEEEGVQKCVRKT